jgi:DNA repair protein RAD50
MAQIKKLMVQGIRSFDPDAAKDTGQVMEFYSPMTLIVGQNGCGKTVNYLDFHLCLCVPV